MPYLFSLPRLLSSYSVTMTVHASLPRKISFLLYSLRRLFGRAGFLANLLVAEGQFLVWLIKVGAHFLPFSGWFLCTMAWKNRLSVNEARHAILLSDGEDDKRFFLTQIDIEASQCDAGHLVRDTKGIFFA